MNRIKTLEKAIIANNTLYRKGQSGTVSDIIYDNMREELRRLDPKNKLLLQIGDKVDKRGKVKLPYPMGSLVDMKPGTGKIKKWLDMLPKKTNLIGSLKLDGTSVELIYEKGIFTKAYSRGDGYEGQDITNKIRRIKNVPLKVIGLRPLIGIRGEAILKEKVFQEKFSNRYENARNAISGVINSQDSVNFELLDEADFIAYERMDVKQENKLNQLLWLEDEGFKVVGYFPIDMKNMNDKYLEEVYSIFKKDEPYFIDGIVIDVDSAETRKNLGYETNSLDPKYARAFKTVGESFEATVSKIEWRVSKHGVIVPRVHVNPVKHSGVTITHTSGFNAGYIRDNDIGKGAKLKMVRSGEVIPHILSVVKKSKVILPTFCSDCGSKLYWNESTGINLICDNIFCPARMKKKAAFFIKNIGVKNVAEGTINKLAEYGYESIDDIIDLSIEDLKKIEGIQQSTAESIYYGIRNALNEVSLPVLMHASGFFGGELGSRKLAMLEDVFREDLLSQQIMTADIIKVKGFDIKSANAFIKGLPPFIKWFIKNSQLITLAKISSKTGSKLLGYSFVFTGIRDKEIETIISNNGGKVSSSISKNTSILITKQIGSGSSKEVNANNLNVPVMKIDDFKKWLDKTIK